MSLPSVLVVAAVLVGSGFPASTPAAVAKTDPLAAAVTAAINDQFAGFRDTKRASTIYAKNAMLAMTGGTSSPHVNKLTDADGKWTLFGPAKVGAHKIRDLRVVLARDGNSAWASFNVKVTVDGLSKSGPVDFRATELFIKTTSGWQVQAAAWSTAISAAKLVKAAKAGSLAALETVFDQDLGARDVLAAVKAFATSGLDATAITRKDIVGIGAASGERVIGGKPLAAKLAKDWSGMRLDGKIWAVSTGTSASATVNVMIRRGGADVPARLFVVFERGEASAWSPVLVHLAAAPPA